MDPLILGLFVLALAGSVWTTVYAFVEYRTERLEQFESTLEYVVHKEVSHQYLWPLLYDKMSKWEAKQQHELGPVDVKLTPETVRVLFIDLRRALLLSPNEFSVYTGLCEDAMRRRRVWMRASTIGAYIDDACCTYMWQRTTLDDFWNYLQRVYVE